MPRAPFRTLAVLALACCALTVPAQAQVLGRSGVSQGAGGQLLNPGTMPDPSGVANRNIVGPRLEPGAVLCRTAEALAVRQSQVSQALADGSDDPALPGGCALVPRRVAVEVLERRGAGRTRVKTLANRPEEGWTDALIPTR